MKCGLSSSAILAEAKDSKDSTVESEETVSETSSSFRMICSSSSISDTSDPEPPDRSLCMADFAVSTNHSSSGSTLSREL